MPTSDQKIAQFYKGRVCAAGEHKQENHHSCRITVFQLLK